MSGDITTKVAPTTAPTIRRLGDLSGPRGLPMLGNLLQLRRGQAHQTVEEWSQRYGPYFKFKLGDRRFLGVGDHEALAAVLRDRPEGFRRSTRLASVMAEIGMQPGVFISNGEAWRRQRRLVMPAFDPAHVKAYFPALLNVTQRLHRRWRIAAAAGAWIDLRSDLMRYTVDGVAGLAFGAPVNTLESGGDVIQKHLDHIFPAILQRALSAFPIWRYYPSAEDQALLGHVAAIQGAIRGFITLARERMQAHAELAEHPSNLLEALLAAAQKEDGAITDDEVAGNVFTMLLAGEDTTANTLAWLIWLLARNPTALARCAEEVQAVAPELESLSMEEIAGLDYLDACISEAMRLKPVAPTIILEAMRPTTVGDVQIEAGTLVWGIYRHDTLDARFFPDPQAFEPQRWLQGGAQGMDSAKRVAMPFGGGPRICPGRYLALLEIKMAMAMLLANFHLDEVSTPDGGEPRECLSLTMAPDKLRMRLRVR